MGIAIDHLNLDLTLRGVDKDVEAAQTIINERADAGGGPPAPGNLPVMRKASDSGLVAYAQAQGDADVYSLLGQSSGRGLDDASRGVLEGYFGRDLSGVRIHTDDVAARSARMLGAEAFTLGEDIYFGHASFRPSTADGLGLLGHEVAHVIQGYEGQLKRELAGRGALGLSTSRTLEAFAEEHERRIKNWGLKGRGGSKVESLTIREGGEQAEVERIVRAAVERAERLLDEAGVHGEVQHVALRGRIELGSPDLAIAGLADQIVRATVDRLRRDRPQDAALDRDLIQASPISWMVKKGAKSVTKKLLKEYLETQIKAKLKKLAQKNVAKKFAAEADRILDALEDPWWMTAIDLIPIVGDAVTLAQIPTKYRKVWRRAEMLGEKTELLGTRVGNAIPARLTKKKGFPSYLLNDSYAEILEKYSTLTGAEKEAARKIKKVFEQQKRLMEKI